MFNNLDVTMKSLDATLLRHSALSNNIANVDTPRYKRIDVAFEEYLDKQIKIKGTKNIDLAKIDASIYTDRASYYGRMDGNNVDIESEMSELAKNKLRYDTLIQRTSAQISRYKTILNGIK